MKIEPKPTKIKLPPVRLDLDTLSSIETLAKKYYEKITFKASTATYTYFFDSVTEIKSLSIKEACFYSMEISFGQSPHPLSVSLSNSYSDITIKTEDPIDIGIAEKLKLLLSDTSSIFTKLLYHNESAIFIPLFFALLTLICSCIFLPFQFAVSFALIVQILASLIHTIKILKFPCYTIIFLKQKPFSFMQLIKADKKTFLVSFIYPTAIGIIGFLLGKFFK